ncbi:DUF4376 domain-containing protein [Pseudomonas sp. SWRI196]|uniref:DUF4376 domain-containing protein n=1 Tax=Pseudomonas tehranensis TaxID=2745502 RepID=A0ABR6UPN6_9PSED|nr:DUF4376 domain-containing protein [Pseudomonas tehranensis]MBC3346551.1 DUF4376 domain-containing protein [Pseudomonas tehranensis]
MKYVTFDEAGTLKLRLIRGVNDIPEDALEVDESLWLRITQEQDGVWQLVSNEIKKVPLPATPPNFAQLVADERYRRETSGVLVDGLLIETTRDSQALIAGTGLSAILDSEYRCNFKTVSGFVEIDAGQIIAIAKAVRTHVQACFDREFTLLQAIEAGDYHDDMLTSGWPDSPAM